MQIFSRFNQLKYWNSTRLIGRVVVLGVSASVMLHSTNANAAENVVLKYGSFQGKVSVRELSQFVETGKTTPALEAYLKTARQEPSLARKALTASIKADPAFLNNLLSSWAGPILVDQIAEVVHPPAGQLNEQALHSALNSSINQTGEVTLLGAIRNYPATSVEIEGDRLIPVYQRLSRLAKGL
jgi:hypothetical protein